MAKIGCSEDLPYSQAQISTLDLLGHVSAKDPTQERRQDARLLECGREQASCRWPSRAGSRFCTWGRSIPRRLRCGARPSRYLMTTRDIRGHSRCSRRSLRRHRARHVGRPTSPVGHAAMPAAPMGRLLARRAVVAGVGTRPVLGRPASPSRQRHAMGSGPAGAGLVPADRAGQRVEAASRLVRQECHGRPAGGRLRIGRGAQALRLP